jgi:hypothetical protein
LITVEHNIYVMASSPAVQELLASAHGAGHEGAQKTLHRLHANFIPGTRSLIQDFIRACATCQRNKSDQLDPMGLLQPLDLSFAVWTDISLDFVDGFPKVNGKSVILTVVDWFSKFAHFIPLGHPYMATLVARAFFTEIVRLHDLPSSIVSDHDPTFTSNFWA